VVVVRRAAAALACAIAIAFGPACRPDLDGRVSLVSAPRVLAVRAEPAEAAPRANVTYRALVVDASGEVTAPSLDWAYCNDRKPLAQLGPVSPACLQRAADFLSPLGVGAAVTASTPETACRQFGPDVPQAKLGEPAGRPVDPDPTGGYYQPLRLALATPAGDAFTLGRARITCGLFGATSEQLHDFASRYRANANPSIDALTLAGGAVVPIASSGAVGTASTGERLTLRAAWSECPDRTQDCTGAETYAVFDLVSRSVVDHRESMRVAWFASAGTFDVDHVGRDGEGAVSFVEDAWTAPPVPGRVHVWLVVRDDRGGVGWESYEVDVK
jgi:hypothetical protein